MDAIARPVSVCVLLLLCLGQSAPQTAVHSDDLHAQAAAAVLQRDFAAPELSYLLLDEKGQVIAQRWEQADAEVPVGSLIKPFIAVAYGHEHGSYPRYRCAGKKTCWLPRGHGNISMRLAIAQSCNSYFHQLAANAEPDFAASTLQSYGLSPQTDGHSGSATPVALARAFLQLANESRDKIMAPIVEGMELSARTGTGKAAGAALTGRTLLAKTGTAPCTHAKKAPGDGFAVVLTPADQPQMALLVRVHGRPGSVAAGLAGKMLAAVEDNGGAR